MSEIAIRCSLCRRPADGISWQWSQADTRTEVPLCYPCKDASDAADRSSGQRDLYKPWHWVEELTEIERERVGVEIVS